MLCTDKTGTLTRNKLTIRNPQIMDDATMKDLMETALLACPPSKRAREPIDSAVVQYVRREHEGVFHNAIVNTVFQGDIHKIAGGISTI